MRGIILAGGRGSRLAPLTKAVSKQLLPVYKYPMIYFPINTLIEMGIKDILIITTPEHQSLYKETLKDLTCANFSYIVQDSPRGLPEAFILGEEWLQGSDVALVLGDNIIINNRPLDCVANTVFSYKVKNPERYGVLDFDDNNRIKNIVEKPQKYISDNAMIGLYVLENCACEIAKKLKPSSRGELEIVDLVKEMNKKQFVSVVELDGFWFDAGNHDDLLDCANLVKAIEHRTNKSFDLT
jgi:glucose-1-phosphate thymidylyltransferase